MLPTLPDDFSISFELTPGKQTVKGGASIVHFTQGANKNVGGRVPAVFFYPGSRRLHVIDGHKQNANDECPIKQPLAPGVKTHIRIELSRVKVK
eukprot:COSAG01_NODE_36235_length_520_cov_1.059382_1_plen_93_part_10